MYNVWLTQLYEREIKDIEAIIRNEHLLEISYDGREPNPHSYNIENMHGYITVLKNKLEELK